MKTIIFTVMLVLALTGIASAQNTNAPMMSIKQLIEAVNTRGDEDHFDVRAAKVLQFPAQPSYPCKEIDSNPSENQGPYDSSLYALQFSNQTIMVIATVTFTNRWMFSVTDDGKIKHALYGVIHQRNHDLINEDPPRAVARLLEEQQYWSDWLATNSAVASGKK